MVDVSMKALFGSHLYVSCKKTCVPFEKMYIHVALKLMTAGGVSFVDIGSLWDEFM